MRREALRPARRSRAVTPRHSSSKYVAVGVARSRRCSASCARDRVARRCPTAAAGTGPAARARARAAAGASRVIDGHRAGSPSRAPPARPRSPSCRMRASRLRVGVAGEDAVADRNAELERDARRRRAPIRWRRSRSGRSRRGSRRRARPARRSRRSARAAAARAALRARRAPSRRRCRRRRRRPRCKRAQRAGEQAVADRAVEARQHDADAAATRRAVRGVDATRRHRSGPAARARGGCSSKPVTSRSKPAMLGILRGRASSRILPDVEVAQDLRADAVVAQVHLRRRRRLVGERAAAQLAGAISGRCSSTTTPRPASRDRRERAGNAPRVRRALRRRAGRSPTAARARAPASRCPGEIGPRTSARCVASVELVAVDDEPERAVRRRERALGDALDQPLGAAAVLDQVGDRADLAARARARTRSRSGRRAIVPSSFMISQITAAGVRPASAREVAAGLGVAGAHQHAAGLRDQREDVAGLHDVARPSRRAATATRTVRARSAAEMPVVTPCRGLDRHGEVGAVHRAVARRSSARSLSRSAVLGA